MLPFVHQSATISNSNFYYQANMRMHKILEEHGWEVVQRQGWDAVQDHRPEFRTAFTTNRVGKIIETSFYVTLQLPEITKDLITQLGCKPVSIKSTNGARDATYWGFDTKNVPDEDLKTFAGRLASAINGLI
jgi:hypothetical protein